MRTLKKALVGIAIISVISVVWKFYPHDNPQQYRPQYDHPNEAQLHEFMMTKDPALGYPPVERLKKAKSQQQSMWSRARAIQGVEWTERGPDNVGGRTRAIMFDPNEPSYKKVWAAGVTGGLWSNNDITNEGVLWQKVDDFIGSLAVNNITYDPNDQQVFYFGTGEGWFGQGMIRGNGIWKSADGGGIWNVLPSTDGNTEFSYVQKVVVTNNSTLLAATRNTTGGGSISRSINGGASWTKEIDGRGADIEIAGDTIYASIGIDSPGSLFRSVNDGADWTDITPSTGGQRIEVGVSGADHQVVYAVAGDADGNVPWFYRSDDAGESWVELAIPKYLSQGSCTASSDDFARQQAWYDLIIGVHPQNAELVTVGGIDLHRSEDGGITWESISYWASDCEIQVHADQHNIIFRPGYPDQAIATNDGGIYYTKDITISATDGGPVFEVRNKGYNVTQLYSCATLNEAGSNYFLAGAQDNGSHQFDKVGLNPTFEITGGDGGYCFIDQDDPDIQITSYVQNNFFITNDFWTNVKEVGSGDKGLFINPADYNSSSNTLYAAGDDGALLRYKNIQNASSVSENSYNLGIDQISAVTVSPYDEDTIFAGTVLGTIHMVKKANSGVPVAIDISNNISTGYISNIAVGSSNQHLLVTSSSYGVLSVWETTDGGQTWVNKEGNLPDMPIRWALYNPNNYDEILIATDLGIWSTDQLSANPPEWEATNNGLANVRCDMIKYREADGLVVVATHGRGLYTSDILADTAYAEFYLPDVVAYANQPVRFIDASVKPVSFSWDFGDGGVSVDTDPSHVFTTAGDFEVTLTINGDDISARSRTVSVLPAKAPDYLLATGGDFESNAEDFKPITLSGSGFELGISGLPNKNGTNSGQKAWVLDPSSSQYEPYSEAYLYTPAFDFSLSGNYSLEFFTKYAIEDQWDGFLIQYSIDNGITWQKLGDFLEVENWYNTIAIDQNGIFPPGKPFFSGTTNGQFVKKSIDLSFLSSHPLVAFRFVFKSDPASEDAGVVLDDFQLIGPDVTIPNVNFMANNTDVCEQEPVAFQNQSSGEILSYSWDFGTDAEPQDATGFGPHEVIYSSEGTKTVTLTATTSGDDIVQTVEVEVHKKASGATIIQGLNKVCENEKLNVSIEPSESGTHYVLMDGETVISDTITGNGSDLPLNSFELTTGEKSLVVKAFISGNCPIDIPLGNLKVNKIPVAMIIQNDNNFISTLTTALDSGDTYQWYLDGNPVDGATQLSFIPELTGSYTLEISLNGCTGTSEAFDYAPLSLKKLEESSIYPNPTNGEVNIKMSTPGDYRYRIIDVAGKIIISGMIKYQKEFRVNLSTQKAGTYYIRIVSDDGSITRKIIKR